MSKFRPWAIYRRLQYAFGFVAVCNILAFGVYFLFFYSAATCFDGLQNGQEIGLDCGGGCVRICAFTVTPPEIVWSESFKIIDGQYNAVAYIENKNAVAASPALAYKFKLSQLNSGNQRPLGVLSSGLLMWNCLALTPGHDLMSQLKTRS